MLGLKMLIIYQAMILAAFSDGLPMDKKIGGRVKRQILDEGPDFHHHTETVDSAEPSQGHDTPPPRSYNSPCQFDIKERCKGSSWVMTCDSIWNQRTQAHEHRCYYGINGTDVTHLVTCCIPCCERPGDHDIYKWCSDTRQEDVTCIPDVDAVLPTPDAVLPSPDGCLSLYNSGERRNGVYETQHGSVFCDMELDGGGWTLIQQRVDGSVSFARDWHKYQTGFGNMNNNYWMGLNRIHELTSTPVELYVYLESFEGERKHAKYGSFSVGDSCSNYVLTVSGHSGSAPDKLDQHNGMEFSTIDRDNDRASNKCDVLYGGGGWWYNNCAASNLNGRYYSRASRSSSATHGIYWSGFAGYNNSLKKVRMLVKPIN